MGLPSRRGWLSELITTPLTFSPLTRLFSLKRDNNYSDDRVITVIALITGSRELSRKNSLILLIRREFN
jgi:hypothetical protein